MAVSAQCYFRVPCYQSTKQVFLLCRSTLLPKSFQFLRIAALLFLTSGFSPANAEWHGELTALSNFVYRGYSKSQGQPVVQGHLDYQDAAGWFGGLGVSQVNFDNRPNSERATVEINPYVGWTMPISEDWRAELSVSGYVFDGKIFAQSADYAEFHSAIHYKDWLSGKVSVAPDAYQRHVTIPNYEIIYRRDLLDNVQLSAGLGYYQAEALVHQNLFYWNLGASWFITPYLAVDIRYVDVHLKEAHDGDLDYGYNEFYPKPLNNKYLLSITLGF